MKRPIALALLTGLLLAGCATSDDGVADTSVPPAETTTTTVAVTTTSTKASTTTTIATTTTGEADADIVITRNVPYVDTGDGATYTVDVYAPASGGPWPVVVAYHGGPEPKKTAVAGLARRLAAAGAVVFAPEWRGLPFSAMSQQALVSWSPCSLWFAADHAADHGGDPSNISVFGISAGASKAAVVSLYPPADHEGCMAAPADVEPRLLILHEGAFGLHPGLDDVFRDEPGLFASTTVWSRVDSAPMVETHLLVDVQTLADRTYDATTYLRSPTESIEESLSIRDPGLHADAVRLGLLDDEEMNIAEVSVLLEDRMRAAGHDVTLAWFDAGSHAITDAVIAYTIGVVTGG